MIEELESLLFDWETGTLDDSGVSRIREILRSSEDARKVYLQHQMLSAALKLDVDAGLTTTNFPETTQTTPASTPKKTTNRVFRVSYWAVTAAAVLLFVLTGRLVQLELAGNKQSTTTAETGPGNVDREEPTSEGVALITQLVDIQWEDDQLPLEVGDAIRPGRLAIESGFAQIEFFCGATVIVEGPAELDLQSPQLAQVRSGRIRAQVPPAARGFALQVDDMTVVDLGTEFGLSVTESEANIQVFDGEVELQQPASEKRLLTTGDALIRGSNGTYSKTEVTPDQFLDIATIESRAANQRDERYLRWKAWSEKFRRDNRLIAYYDFNQEGNWLRRLESSLQPEKPLLNGAIVGANQVNGRWTSKSGLEFKRPGDRVRVQIPGEFTSLTFACWVKIDSLDRWYNSLFLTDHYNQGEPHWQILDTGQLFFSVRHKPDDVRGDAKKAQTHQPVLSPSFWKPSLSGRWLHVATAYDAKSGRVTHFLNGEILHEETIDPSLVVGTTRIGPASIGNWSIPTRQDSEFAIRNLNGSIDEFAIFAAALSADEIKEIYNNGKP
ncbi:LamG-like jellyroll fold domain-containing protein [Thalassoroseus pseudoceratinae]|uniref:LamG-like jellyroll fold domain-containing protein n=1 Tax=Thalassoroseus pseudoceratinae TaxID=2713176 RepID=UPI001F0DD6DE|nr:LamG-like jellyroll fold domain-containing protein [Thalassoroseus pseudoceratinae]